MSKSPLKRISNLLWERYLGIKTGGIVPIDYPDAVYYATMDYADIFRILQALALQPTDVFFDIGVGKGRAICLAARQSLHKAIGVDISSELCSIATSNLKRVRSKKTPTVILNCSAIDADYSEASVVWLFNPFGAETTDRVLRKLRADRDGRPLRIAYCTPTHEAVFASHKWLEIVDKATYYPVNFYRSH